MLARYYASELGRFLSVDPGPSTAARLPQTWNRYAYARDNPVVLIDPTGEAATYSAMLHDTAVLAAQQSPTFRQLARYVQSTSHLDASFVRSSTALGHNRDAFSVVTGKLILHTTVKGKKTFAGFQRQWKSTIQGADHRGQQLRPRDVRALLAHEMAHMIRVDRLNNYSRESKDGEPFADAIEKLVRKEMGSSNKGTEVVSAAQATQALDSAVLQPTLSDQVQFDLGLLEGPVEP